MSDVFDRLVARATQRTPVLVARRPSRFEPSSTGMGSPALPAADVDSRGANDTAPRTGEILSATSESQRRATPSPSDPERDRGPVGDWPQRAASTAARSAASSPARIVVSPPTRPELGADPHPAETRPATAWPPAAHRSGTRAPRAEHRPAAADALRAPAMASPAQGPNPALAAERDPRRATRESLARNDSRTPTSRTIAPATLLAEHLGPALVEARALTEAEVARLVAVAPEDRDRTRRDGRTPIAIEPVEVPVTAEVHLHIDHLEVRRPPAQPPAQLPPARATREPAGSRPVDHAAYLDRQRRRGGLG